MKTILAWIFAIDRVGNLVILAQNAPGEEIYSLVVNGFCGVYAIVNGTNLWPLWVPHNDD